MKNIILCGLALCSSIQAMNDLHSEAKQQSPLINGVIGAIAGVTEAILEQPLLYFKNTLQRGDPIEWFKPKIWYRGLGMNIVALTPSIGLQTASNTSLKSVMPGSGMPIEMSRAFIAGLTSVLLWTPVELIMLDQQKKNRNILETARCLIKEAGWRVLFRGSSAIALREGPWAVSYLVGFPLAQKAIKNQIDNPIVGNVGAYFGAGALVGSAYTVTTQPFDTIQICMQADYQGIVVKNMRDAVRNIYRTRGIKGFFSGVVPRTINCGFAIPLIGTLIMYLSKKAEEYS